MGGADSEVSAATRVIALESAWFEPTGIRRTSKRLGLSTEASYRFERGADIERRTGGAGPCLRAARDRSARAGRCLAGSMRIPRRGSGGMYGSTPHVSRQVLGADVPVSQITSTLEGLGFAVSHQDRGRARPALQQMSGPASAAVPRCDVPSWRVDVSRDVDLIEEIARHFGYDRLPTTFPALDADARGTGSPARARPARAAPRRGGRLRRSA